MCSRKAVESKLNELEPIYGAVKRLLKRESATTEIQQKRAAESTDGIL